MPGNPDSLSRPQGRRTLKLGGSRGGPGKAAPSGATGPAPGGPTYFGTFPAQLPPQLAGLRGSVLTKAGVRGAPGLNPAQVLLAQTLLKRRFRGELLDLSAMSGLLGALPGVTLRPVEGSAPALAALFAAGYQPLAAVPDQDLGQSAQV
ncbi:MAG: hypothetical protein ACR2J4_09805, partial [Deinococcus sp.]